MVQKCSHMKANTWCELLKHDCNVLPNQVICTNYIIPMSEVDKILDGVFQSDKLNYLRGNDDFIRLCNLARKGERCKE